MKRGWLVEEGPCSRMMDEALRKPDLVFVTVERMISCSPKPEFLDGVLDDREGM